MPADALENMCDLVYKYVRQHDGYQSVARISGDPIIEYADVGAFIWQGIGQRSRIQRLRRVVAQADANALRRAAGESVSPLDH